MHDHATSRSDATAELDTRAEAMLAELRADPLGTGGGGATTTFRVDPLEAVEAAILDLRGLARRLAVFGLPILLVGMLTGDAGLADVVGRVVQAAAVAALVVGGVTLVSAFVAAVRMRVEVHPWGLLVVHTYRRRQVRWEELRRVVVTDPVTLATAQLGWVVRRLVRGLAGLVFRLLPLPPRAPGDEPAHVVDQLELVDGSRLRLEAQLLMDPEVAMRMTAAITRGADVHGVGVVTARGTMSLAG